MALAAAHYAPVGLAAILRLESKRQGYRVSSDFDRLAMAAAALRDVGHSSRQLSNTIKKCVTGHAAYHIVTVPAPKW